MQEHACPGDGPRVGEIRPGMAGQWGWDEVIAFLNEIGRVFLEGIWKDGN